MSHVETTTHDGEVLAIVIRSSVQMDATDFLTEPSESFQVGFIVKAAGEDVPPHRHHPIERQLAGTSEVLIVRKGRCELDLFGPDGALVSTSVLEQGDVAVLLRGAHGIRIQEDTVFLEVKQGPYPGVDEKEQL